MFRFVFRALLPVIGALLTYQVIFAAVPQNIKYSKKIMASKSFIMSNISLALYLTARKFIPIALVPDQEEWRYIDGTADEYPPGEIYSPRNSDILD